ncbi:MAG: 2-C-methyl-D-erythritol 4-phosphate cytidylyltransferase [Erysipelotrichaceae bacterium]|nr:2-C-methyl-D-erythritol 4-phosphate cytidylyltransferase [Erysipelotrichaceae bacterium]
MKYSAIVVAAGSSTRFSGEGNKLLYKLKNGKTVIENTLHVFMEDEDCGQIIVVTNDDVRDYLVHQCRGYGKMLYCYGGKTRQESVQHGLMAVSEDTVLVHDGARCFLLKEDLEKLKAAIRADRGAILCKKVTDTVKIVSGDRISRTVDRDTVKLAQTPQGFTTAVLTECYRKASRFGFMATDDAQVVEKYGHIDIAWIESSGHNTKITYVEDIGEDQ